MLRGYLNHILLDLGELEGEYRSHHLKDDITQGVFIFLIVSITNIAVLVIDHTLFEARPDLFQWMIVYRGAFMLVTAVIIIFIRKVSTPTQFDNLAFVWLVLTTLYITLNNFTRPSDYLTTAFDIIIPFAIYLISPLQFIYNLALAVAFSAGTLYVDLFHKPDAALNVLQVAVIAQVLVHVLGGVSALQMNSYRRRAFQAYILEKDARESVTYFASIDSMTKSMTRGHFLDLARKEFQRSVRYSLPLTLIVLDVDFFKKVNDQHGHGCGDDVLRSLALVLLEQKRVQDVLGRLGGDEFCLLLPHTSLRSGQSIAERIRNVWERTEMKIDSGLVHSSVSLGVTELNPSDATVQDMIQRADKLMYKAKNSGRNRVVAH